MSAKPIPIAPAPWTLKATVYLFTTYTSAAQLPPLAYSSLEAGHPPFTANSKFVGGLGSVQLVRYTESPVGPYDELLIVPGIFEWGGVDGKKEKNLRVSRIYVSQRDTCWNGRKNWNIPKHLARFDFTEPTPGSMKVEIFPTENPEAAKAFFTATYKPIPYLPNFPFSTNILKYLNADPTLVQPPLPEGKGKEEELPGTSEWVKIVPEQFSKKMSLGWWDLKQDGVVDENEIVEESLSKEENWWPGGGRWRIGARMVDATVLFPEGEILSLKDVHSKL